MAGTGFHSAQWARIGWRLRNGIIEITNTRASKRAESLLNTIIPVFTIPDGETAKMASVMLWWNLQLGLDKKLKGFGGDVLGGAKSPTLKRVTLHKRTVREILAYIVLNDGVDGWIVAGPPECLGFTPYCGFSLKPNLLTLQTKFFCRISAITCE
jgi:hypothetical protein